MVSIAKLPRISNMNVFFTDYFQRSLPVVIAGGAKKMGAFQKWNDQFLMEILGQDRPKVRLADGRYARIPFPDFLSYLENPTMYKSNLAPIYLTDYWVVPVLGDLKRAALAPDVKCPLQRGSTKFVDWMTIYAGPKGSSSTMHQDIFSTHTWLAELRGRKTWRICAPSSIQENKSTQINAFGEDEIHCEVFEGVLDAGDLIYLPPDWWHQVVNSGLSTFSISGNFCTLSEAHEIYKKIEEGVLVKNRKVWLPIWKEIIETSLNLPEDC